MATTTTEWSGKRSVQRETLTVGEARSILDRAKEKGLMGQAKLNKSLTKQAIWDLFYGAVEGRQDDEPITPAIVAKNIQREFG